MTIRNDETTTVSRGTTRAMFNSNTSMNPMLRGPQVVYDVDDGTGGGEDEAEAARLAAEAASPTGIAAALAAKKVSDDAEAARVAEEAKKSKPTDAEAALLKDVMKQKAATKKAQDEATAAKTALAEFDGLDPAELKALKAASIEAATAAALAETKEAEKRGEYDRILNQVRTDAKAREDALSAANATTRDELAVANKRIDDLVIGSSFAGSKFLSDTTMLTGDKARKLYGDHFEIEDGQMVAYDKGRGETDRTPLVDSSGTKLGFEAAIEKILKADPDFERMASSTLKLGSGSRQGTTDKTVDPKKPALVGAAAIAAALRAKAAGKK
jgi:hypothetical protein